MSAPAGRHASTGPRFFLPRAVAGTRVVITGPQALHLARSLRARPGERIVVVDAAGAEHGVVLEEVAGAGGETVTGSVEWSRPATGEPRTQAHVLQAVTKDGMDECVDHLTELGAASISPVLTERTVVRPDAAAAARRVERWQAIAREAAQQSGRAAVPPVLPIRPLSDALGSAPAGARILACMPSAEARPLRHAVDPAGSFPLVLCVGPEGGFGDRDAGELRLRRAVPVHLGPRVLRSRVAGTAALAALLTVMGDLDEPVAPPPGAGG